MFGPHDTQLKYMKKHIPQTTLSSKNFIYTTEQSWLKSSRKWWIKNTGGGHPMLTRFPFVGKAKSFPTIQEVGATFATQRSNTEVWVVRIHF